MKILKFFVSIVIVTALLSCQGIDNQKDYSNDGLPISKSGEGYSLGLYNGEIIESKRTFSLTGNSFSKNIVFGNITSSKNSFVLLVFDHYEQIQFEVQNQKYTKYSFTLEPNSYINNPVTLLELENNFHSINYLITIEQHNNMKTANPDDKVLLQELSRIFYIRVNLFNQFDLTKESIRIPNDLSEINSKKIHGVFTNEIGKDYHIFTNKRLEEDEFNLKVIYGNQEKEAFDFYVVALLDWNQIPVTPGLDYVYDYLNPNTEKSFISTVEVNSSGEHILQYLMLPTPFQELPDNNPYPINNVYSSFRLLIDKQ
ncbi:hypothetical protein ACF3MZ_02985 [Paenibacillaceae bacterium WGS1546]|uniref:hypothetical protein n=1 Tax=Cohnella sp. WGS1546 TaxID=3366810 RepID=UPI00372CF165